MSCVCAVLFAKTVNAFYLQSYVESCIVVFIEVAISQLSMLAALGPQARGYRVDNRLKLGQAIFQLVDVASVEDSLSCIKLVIY